jgi:lysophospholipase L1-like esterase
LGEAADGFEGVDSLKPFFDRLARAARDSSPVHILQFGDSHTASDDWVDSMRQIYQEKYGYGGPGFAMAGHPFKGYRRFDVHGESSYGWITQGTVGHQVDGLDGLSGVSLTALRPGETVAVTTAGERLELYYMRYPGAGQFTSEADGVQVQTIDTAGEIATGFYALHPSPGTHTYTVRTLSSQPVRLFGWVSENSSGVTWETLGINGAQARMMLHWDEPLWKEQIQRRDPALVILAYGTNEALYPLWTAADYRKDLLTVVDRFRKAVPNAALLLVGPPDCGRTPFPHLREVIQIQREVAQQTGAAFWNWQAHMDSTGGRAMWVRAGLSQLDYTHLTGDGYKMLGKMLVDEIDAQYQRYKTQPPVLALSGAPR